MKTTIDNTGFSASKEINYSTAYEKEVKHTNNQYVTYNTYDNTKKLSQLLVVYKDNRRGVMLINSRNQQIIDNSAFDGEILSPTSYRLKVGSYSSRVKIWEIYE